MSIKSNLLVGVLGLILFVISGCRKDNPCDTARQGENYMLSDSAKAYISNYNNARRIIFKNSGGNEVAFDVIRKDTTLTYQVGLPCETDASQIQSVQGSSQFIEYSLINTPIWNQSIKINLFKFPELVERDAQENLSVSLGSQFSNSFEEGDGLFHKTFNENNPELEFLDSLVVGGKTFYNVYSMNGNGVTPVLEIKYTMIEGIVYIKDPVTGEEYVYERKEE